MAKRSRSLKGAPGIVDVAERAEVSPATVSRYFNNPDVVKTTTRKRIEKAANDLGYIRDRMAGSMHNRFSGTIGLIVPTIDNAIFSELIEAFASELLRHDRTMLIAAHGYDLKREIGIVRSLLERRIDGIALVGQDHDAIPMNMLAQRNIPVVSIWNFDANSAIPCIGADNFEAGRLAAQHLIDLKHRDITVIFPDTDGNDRARDRLRGVKSVFSSQKLNLSPKNWKTCHYDIGEAKKLTVEILKSKRPTAIVCGNDIISHGVIFACHALGLNVPRDLSIVGIGDFQGSAHMEPGLTTVRLPAKRIGILAANTLVTMNETGTPPKNKHQMVDISLMIRGSTAVV